MPFVTKNFVLPYPKKAFLFVMEILQCTQKEAQKHLDKNRLMQNSRPIHKSETIEGIVCLTYFEPYFLDLKPIFVTPIFAIYDKPPNLLVHPKGYFEHLSLCDAIKSHFGSQANPVHRLDFETSGLVMVSKKKVFEAKLKALFENQKIRKTYLAYARGKIDSSQTINTPILMPNKNNKHKNLSIKSLISTSGRPSITNIKPLSYDKNTDRTLIEIFPLTGRTHQIRIHLEYIGHKIIGEPIYGVNDEQAQNYLKNKIYSEIGTTQLMLHAQSLSFEFENNDYFIKSQQDFIKNNENKP